MADRWGRIDLAQGSAASEIGDIAGHTLDQVSRCNAFAIEALGQRPNHLIASVSFQLCDCATSTVQANERVTLNASAE